MKPMNPGKLQALLRDAADARVRASSVLSFLIDTTSARAGYLLLARNGELVVAASSNQQEPPEPLMERARALWASDQASHGEGENTRTVDARQLGATLVDPAQWQAQDGERYAARVLGIYRGSRWTPVGVCLLAAEAKHTSQIRHAYVDAICNALLDVGDVVATPP
jgi:hypothetical protein